MEFSINNTYRKMVEGFEAEFSEFKSVDRLLSLSTEMKNNPFAKLALSRCFKNLRPSDERWVFMASDGYNLLDMRDEALSVLRRSHENGIKGNFLPRRVFNQYIHCFRFDEAVDFYRANEAHLSRFPDATVEAAKAAIKIFDKSRICDFIEVISKKPELTKQYAESCDYLRNHQAALKNERALITSVDALLSSQKQAIAGRLIVAFARKNSGLSTDLAEKVLCGKSRFIRNHETLDLRRQVQRENPNNPKLLLALVEHTTFLGLIDEAYSLIRSHGLNAINACAVGDEIAPKLYNAFLRLSNVFEDRRTLYITESGAKSLGVTKAHGLDSLNLAASEILEGRSPSHHPKTKVDNDILQSVIMAASIPNHKVGSVCSLISGQIRGISVLEKTLSIPVDGVQNYISTWDKAASTKPRLDLLSKMFPHQFINKLPAEYSTKPTLRKLLPTAIKTLEDEAPKAKVEAPQDWMRSNQLVEKFEIEAESTFESESAENPVSLKVSSRFNQAKMYYKINRAFKAFARPEAHSVIIRIRPDSGITFDASVLSSCIDACKKDKSIIFIPYLNEYGYGDQLAIGSYGAMSLYCSAWKYIKEHGFKYSERFEDVSAHGAEELMANHILAHGLKVRIIPIVSRNLSADNLGCEVVDIRRQVKEDVSKLEPEQAKLIDEFVSVYSEYANKIFEDSRVAQV